MNTIIDGVDFGPLAGLVGTWKGDKGMDVAPEPDDSSEESPYHEELKFEVVGDVGNAEKQKLAVLRYHQKVFKNSDGEQFHDQVGYWIWDAEAKTVMLTITIPRGVSLVAGGQFDSADLGKPEQLLSVASELGGEWGIAQSPFMRDNASTKAYKMELRVSGDKLSYSQTTFLDIYGRSFDHTDVSQLTRV